MFYSIKNRKFIRGFFKGDKVSGDILYQLYPGRYIEFDLVAWARNDPPVKIAITLFELSPNGKKRLASAVVGFNRYDFIQNPEIPEQVKDFWAGRPRYHTRPTVSFDKVYSEQEHQKLLDFVLSKKSLIEGEEHE
jgi:hypothetical protein